MSEDMSYCPACGSPTAAPRARPPYAAPPPPVYPVGPRFGQSPYPVPGYLPYPYYPYMRPDPRQMAASAGCTLMIFDGALALLFSVILVFGSPVIALFLMASSIVAVVGGWLGLKGIQPLMTAAGPPLLIIAAILLLTIDPFMIIVSGIGIVLAGISLALVIYGWSQLVQRAKARRSGSQGYRYPYRY